MPIETVRCYLEDVGLSECGMVELEKTVGRPRVIVWHDRYFEIRAYRPDGSRVYVETSGRIVTDDEVIPVG